MWKEICNTPDNLPQVKVHGFSITTYDLIVRYPWWSIDSTTHRKMAYHGQILAPEVSPVTGEFCFDIPNTVLFMDPTRKYSRQKKNAGKRPRHFLHLPVLARERYEEWFHEINVPLGRRNNRGRVIEIGMTNHEGPRQAATIEYFTRLVQTLPDWPWPFVMDVQPRLYEAVYGKRG
jgi:hypothetical protein